jgi:hypothetical protein
MVLSALNASRPLEFRGNCYWCPFHPVRHCNDPQEKNVPHSERMVATEQESLVYITTRARDNRSGKGSFQNSTPKCANDRIGTKLFCEIIGSTGLN